MIDSMVMGSVAFWQSMNSFWRAGVSAIITASFTAIQRSVSVLSNILQIRTLSIIFAKPGFMADTLLILAFPSFRSLWRFPMSVLLFSPNCWSPSWASHDLVCPFTLRLLMNAPKASWMMCAIHGMRFRTACYSIPEASSVDCSFRVIQ